MKKILLSITLIVLLGIVALGIWKSLESYLAPSQKTTDKSADAPRTYTQKLPQAKLEFTYPDNWAYTSLTAASGHADRTDHVILTAPNGLCLLFGSVAPKASTDGTKLGPIVVNGADRILQYNSHGVVVLGDTPAIAIYPACTSTGVDDSKSTSLQVLQENPAYGQALQVIATLKPF